MPIAAALVALALAAAPAPTGAVADVAVVPVDYADDAGAALRGLLALPPGHKVGQKHPAVVVIHDWMGVDTGLPEAEIKRLAAMGYVAFAADIYGKGVRPKDAKEAGAQAGKFKADRPLLQRRAQAALKVVAEHAAVDSKKVAAIGFCFGGTAAIELAKSGADLAGVVSFHGGLDAAVPGASKNIKAKVLALHGAADPFVAAKDLAAWRADLDAAKVDWQLVEYAGAVHAFTNPKAGNDPAKGAAYDERADRRARVAMKSFFDELF